MKHGKEIHLIKQRLIDAALINNDRKTAEALKRINQAVSILEDSISGDYTPELLNRYSEGSGM